MDGETKKNSNGRGNTKGKRVDGEIQRESNGSGNTKVFDWMRKLKRIRRNGETQRESNG